MEKSTGLLSHFAFALMLVAASSAATVARGDARPAHHQTTHQSSATTNNTTSTNSLPESKVLLQNDNVLPTQNRTQAMALEAENGKLPAGEEDELKNRGLIKQVNADHRR